MKYICPICGKIVDPRTDNAYWKIRYKGYIITHDPFGCLACYLEKGDKLEWCYFGCSIDVIKFEIDRRCR